MSDRRARKDATRKFSLEQVRADRARVLSAARKGGGCIVVDEKGERLFSLWIPQTPISDGD
jgi:hypothetical protein